jgi:hypothetical protein
VSPSFLNKTFCTITTAGVQRNAFLANLELRCGTYTTTTFLKCHNGGRACSTVEAIDLANTLRKDEGLMGSTPSWRPSGDDPHNVFTNVVGCDVGIKVGSVTTTDGCDGTCSTLSIEACSTSSSGAQTVGGGARLSKVTTYRTGVGESAASKSMGSSTASEPNTTSSCRCVRHMEAGSGYHLDATFPGQPKSDTGPCTLMASSTSMPHAHAEPIGGHHRGSGATPVEHAAA